MPKKEYLTKQREYLIEFFKNNAEVCFMIEDIVKQATENGIMIGQTTIYRNLEKLVGEGIIIKHNMPDGGGAYFQYAECDGGHYHLFCTECKAVTHLDCDYLNKILTHLRKEHNFNFNTKTVFYGRCQKCERQ